jgi:DNA polymerase-3 subunit alpha
MDYLEECGLVKMDFLGLKTLTIIKNTVVLLKRRGVNIDIDRIPENDPATFRLLGEGRSTCIFQFESQGMQEILRKSGPTSIPDLIALNALYRPGPMEYIDQFIDAKNGKKRIQYPLPELEPILKETYGVIVYQEQVMEIARQVAGYSLGEADILRRAMGKKKVDVMARQKVKFLKGAAAKGYSGAQAEKIFELLVPFAGYGFNKSHAAAYSLLAYQTAYLKANYPAEFMAANLTNEINSTDKLAEYISEARIMGLEVLPPDINVSEQEFTVRDGKIVYGLRGIKNVGSAAVDHIVEERNQGGPYKDLTEFLKRLDLKTVNRKVVETLIRCGLFDGLGTGRAVLMHNLDRILETVNSYKEIQKYGQTTLFDPLEETESPLIMETCDPWPALEKLTHEKQNLGFYFSGHPLDKYREHIQNHCNLDLSQLTAASDQRTYTVIGILKEIKEITTRTGRRMAFAQLEDFRGTVELVLFSDIYEKLRERLVGDSVVAVRGRIDNSRGEPKLIVESLLDPVELKEKPARAVHVRFSSAGVSEEQFLRLRDFIVGKPGDCGVYFHIRGNGAGGDIVIKASPHITLSAEDRVLSEVREHPLVEEVWKE